RALPHMAKKYQKCFLGRLCWHISLLLGNFGRSQSSHHSNGTKLALLTDVAPAPIRAALRTLHPDQGSVVGLEEAQRSEEGTSFRVQRFDSILALRGCRSSVVQVPFVTV